MEKGRGRGGEGRREDETGGKRTSKGGDSKHITPACIDNSATYPWDMAHTNIHPPFQSGPLILVGWCSLSSSPSPPNNIGHEQLTSGRHTHLNEYNIPSPEQKCLWPCQEKSFVATGVSSKDALSWERHELWGYQCSLNEHAAPDLLWSGTTSGHACKGYSR